MTDTSTYKPGLIRITLDDTIRDLPPETLVAPQIFGVHEATEVVATEEQVARWRQGSSVIVLRYPVAKAIPFEEQSVTLDPLSMCRGQGCMLKVDGVWRRVYVEGAEAALKRAEAEIVKQAATIAGLRGAATPASPEGEIP